MQGEASTQEENQNEQARPELGEGEHLIEIGCLGARKAINNSEKYRSLGRGASHKVGKAITGTLNGSAARNKLKGKVIVLDFWATWCSPCIAGIPDLETRDSNLEWDQDEIEWKDGVSPIAEVIIKPFSTATSATWLRPER